METTLDDDLAPSRPREIIDLTYCDDDDDDEEDEDEEDCVELIRRKDLDLAEAIRRSLEDQNSDRKRKSAELSYRVESNRDAKMTRLTSTQPPVLKAEKEEVHPPKTVTPKDDVLPCDDDSSPPQHETASATLNPTESVNELYDFMKNDGADTDVPQNTTPADTHGGLENKEMATQPSEEEYQPDEEQMDVNEPTTEYDTNGEAASEGSPYASGCDERYRPCEPTVLFRDCELPSAKEIHISTDESSEVTAASNQVPPPLSPEPESSSEILLDDIVVEEDENLLFDGTLTCSQAPPQKPRKVLTFAHLLKVIWVAVLVLGAFYVHDRMRIKKLRRESHKPIYNE